MKDATSDRGVFLHLIYSQRSLLIKALLAILREYHNITQLHFLLSILAAKRYKVTRFLGYGNLITINVKAVTC